MNNLRYYTLLTCVLFLTNLGIQAHVDLDNPKGGEVFAPGDAITIEWHSEIEHVQIGWNLFFSPDGGNTWDTLAMGLEVERNSFLWIVADLDTEHAKIRIVQDNIDLDYEDRSRNMTITGSVHVVTGLADDETHDLIHSGRIFPNPFIGTTTIEYNLKSPSQVTIKIMDTNGKLIKTLLKRFQPAGVHSIQWNSYDRSKSFIREGVYIVLIQADHTVRSYKLIVGF